MTGSPDAAPTPARTLGADTRPKVGDRVKVTVEGTVNYAEHGWVNVAVQNEAATIGGTVELNHTLPGVSVEVLTPPAPTYKAGDVVTNGVGSTVFFDGRKWTWGDGSRTDDPPTCKPITLLVRAGKVVGP